MTDFNKNQNHFKLTEQMTNSQISVDFMLCNINSLLHQAKNQKNNQNSSAMFVNILESLYQSFLIHKQQLSNLFINVQKYIEKSECVNNNEAIIALREDFFSKLQSLEILVFQQDKQELIKRIGQYKKISIKNKNHDQDQSQSSFFESSISKSQEQNQFKCQEFQLHDKNHENQQANSKNRLKTNVMDQAFCAQSQSDDQSRQFNLVFDNIEIKQAHSIQCFMSQEVQKAIQQIQDQNTQFQKKQQIWLEYLQKCSQSQSQLNHSQQQLLHVKEEQIIHAIETFRTQMSLKQQSNRQSGIQQLIQTRFYETENINQYQLENKKFNSPFKQHFHFALTENNQQSHQIYRTKSKSKSKTKNSTIKNKNKNLSQVVLKNKQSSSKNKQKSAKKVSKNKENDHDQIQSLAHIKNASNQKNINKNDKLDQLSAKIQKKLCLNINKQQRQNPHLQTDKKISILSQKLKKDKSSQKKTVKKTLVSFCF